MLLLFLFMLFALSDNNNNTNNIIIWIMFPNNWPDISGFDWWYTMLYALSLGNIIQYCPFKEPMPQNLFDFFCCIYCLAIFISGF